MPSKFEEYKAVAGKLKIVIDIPNSLLDNAVFFGLSFGLFVGEKLVITLPFLPKNGDDLVEYQNNLRHIFLQHGTVKKVALYQDNRNGSIFALPQSKSKFYRLNDLFSLRCGLSLNKVPQSEQVIKAIHEDQSNHTAYGVFDLLKSSYTFEEFTVFHRKLLTEEIIFDLIPLSVFLGTGHYIEGYKKLNKKNKERTFIPNYLPKHLHFLNQIKNFNFHKDSLTKIRSNGSFSNNECVYLFSRFVKKTLRTGDTLDLDWFGREFGFWATNEDGNPYRFYSGSKTDKGFNCPINELEH
jgi:hypothetical protein